MILNFKIVFIGYQENKEFIIYINFPLDYLYTEYLKK